MTDSRHPDEELLDHLDDPGLDDGHLSAADRSRLDALRETRDALAGTSTDVDDAARQRALTAALTAYDEAAAVEGRSSEGATPLAGIAALDAARAARDARATRARRVQRWAGGVAAAGALLFIGVSLSSAVTNKANNASSEIRSSSDKFSDVGTAVDDGAASDAVTAAESSDSAGRSDDDTPITTVAGTPVAPALVGLGEVDPADAAADVEEILDENADAVATLLTTPATPDPRAWDPILCADTAIANAGGNALPLGAVDVGTDSGLLWLNLQSDPGRYVIVGFGSCAVLASGSLDGT